MGYGSASPVTRVPVSFTCHSCGLVLDLRVHVGKDYCFEETLREAQRLVQTTCGWYEHHGRLYCLECVPEIETGILLERFVESERVAHCPCGHHYPLPEGYAIEDKRCACPACGHRPKGPCRCPECSGGKAS